MREPVIEFRLDEMSGDRLSAARQMVARLAINPNTVHKACRGLEREGLVRTRASARSSPARRHRG